MLRRVGSLGTELGVGGADVGEGLVIHNVPVEHIELVEGHSVLRGRRGEDGRGKERGGEGEREGGGEGGRIGMMRSEKMERKVVEVVKRHHKDLWTCSGEVIPTPDPHSNPATHQKLVEVLQRLVVARRVHKEPTILEPRAVCDRALGEVILPCLIGHQLAESLQSCRKQPARERQEDSRASGLPSAHHSACGCQQYKGMGLSCGKEQCQWCCRGS